MNLSRWSCLLQIATSLEQIQEFLRGTLLFVQQLQLCTEKSLWDVVQQCVDILKEKDLITINTADSRSPLLQITQLGRAAYKGKLLTASHFMVLLYINTWTKLLAPLV